MKQVTDDESLKLVYYLFFFLLIGVIIFILNVYFKVFWVFFIIISAYILQKLWFFAILLA